jgi:Mrp family chromosome partitioning ATPase/capsular polysaccharide biosynthesis protein
MSDLSRSEFGLHLREMWRRGWLIALAALAAGGAMFAYRNAQPTEYISSATVRVVLTENQNDDGTVTAFRTRSLAEQARTADPLTEAATLAGIDATVAQMRGRIDVDLLSTPGYLEVTARGPSPDEAAELANAMAAVMIDLAANDPVSAATGVVVVTVDVADPASSSAPGVRRSISEGIAVGLVAAIVVGEGIVGLRLLRRRFSPVDPSGELQRLVGAPVLDLRGRTHANAVLPFFVEHLSARPVLTVVQMGRPSVEAACRLTKVAGDVHDRVLLVDGDAGRPMLHTAFGQEVSPGLAEVAAGHRALRSVIRPAGADMRAIVLTAGQAQPGGPIGRGLMPALQTLLQGAGADQVVVSVTEASSIDEVLLVSHAFPHAVVLALDPTTVTVTDVRRLLDQLHGVEASVVGVMIMPKVRRVQSGA